MDWIGMAQDRERWRVPLNAVVVHRLNKSILIYPLRIKIS
jgi:hypothetical protein